MRLSRVIALLFFLSCSSDDNPFSGITETDEFAIIIGSVDPSDWQTDENWTNQEISLFPQYANLDLNNSSAESSNNGGSWIGYPNPSSSESIAVTFNGFGTIAFGSIVMVDKSFEVLTEMEFEDDFTMQWNFSEFSPIAAMANKKGLFRVYYVYKYTDDEFIFKGHGDLLIE